MVTSKSLLTGTAVGFALLFGGGAYILSNLNALAKPRAEAIASKALGVKVSIGSLDIDLKAKKASAGNISIANPSGYKKPYAVVIGAADVTLGLLSSELITMESINVGDSKAYLEVTPSGTNLQALKAIIDKQKAGTKSESAIKVAIDKISIRNSTVYPSITLLDSQDFDPVNAGDIVLRGIGTSSNSVLARDAVEQVTKSLLTSFASAAGGAGFYDGLSADTLKDLGVSQIKAVGDRVNERIGGEVDKITGGLKGLFE